MFIYFFRYYSFNFLLKTSAFFITLNKILLISKKIDTQTRVNILTWRKHHFTYNIDSKKTFLKSYGNDFHGYW